MLRKEQKGLFKRRLHRSVERIASLQGEGNRKKKKNGSQVAMASKAENRRREYCAEKKRICLVLARLKVREKQEQQKV
jgi:transposase